MTHRYPSVIHSITLLVHQNQFTCTVKTIQHLVTIFHIWKLSLKAV